MAEFVTKLGFAGFLLIILSTIITYLTSYLFLGNIFRKAGYKRYISIIPFYNIFTFTLLATGSEGWAVVSTLPFVNIIALIYAMWMFFPAFGKSKFFSFCGVFFPLGFIAVIETLVIAMGNAQYMGPAPGWDIDDDEDEEEPIPVKEKPAAPKKVKSKPKKPAAKKRKVQE